MVTCQRKRDHFTVYILDDLSIPVPRHNEINELTVMGIFKECEPRLGKGWWRS